PAAVIEHRQHPALTRADVSWVEREPPAPVKIEIVPFARDVSPDVERRDRLPVLEHHRKPIYRAYLCTRRLTPARQCWPPSRHTLLLPQLHRAKAGGPRQNMPPPCADNQFGPGESRKSS